MYHRGMPLVGSSLGSSFQPPRHLGDRNHSARALLSQREVGAENAAVCSCVQLRMEGKGDADWSQPGGEAARL
eukprot:363125-Chlamydomonas_euryale.AAC.3